jgi:DNA-binding transcriptional LysR family regulator
MTDFDDAKRRAKTAELEIIVAIAASGSLGGAALQLGCTQSRISHALGELEDVLGERLFDRSRTGARPTEAGVVAVSRARAILQMIDRLTVGGAGLGLHGVVRIAAYRSVATHLLTPAILDVTANHRGVRIELDDGCDERSDIERLVHDRRADLGIVHLPTSAGLMTRPFARDAYVAVAAATQLPSKHSFWSDLARLALFELRCSGARAAVEACRRDGMTNRTTASFASDSTIIAQIAARRGMAILPRLAVEPLPAGLVAITLPITAVRELVTVRRRGQSNATVRAVERELVAAVARPSLVARRWLIAPGEATLRVQRTAC